MHRFEEIVILSSERAPIRAWSVSASIAVSYTIALCAIPKSLPYFHTVVVFSFPTRVIVFDFCCNAPLISYPLWNINRHHNNNNNAEYHSRDVKRRIVSVK